MSERKPKGASSATARGSTAPLGSSIRNPDLELALLGSMSAKNFLREHWQKKPLMIRGALPGFQGLLGKEDLIGLACRDDTEARLVTRHRNKWNVRQGPFTRLAFSRLPKKSWTLLVQDINHFLPAARGLLLKFNFLPHFRLDDLMVSYAPAGGGVGPHFDSYDVFLLQGMGHRLWQISAQQDKTLIEDAPLKLLHDFRAEQEWLLEPGDMLYLPPGYAHNGIAQDDCMTYSIGFRAPAYQELVTAFLVYMQDHYNVDGMYHDPDIDFPSQPGCLDAALLHQVSTVLHEIRWGSGDMERFIGMYLTEPKPHVFFESPSKPLTRQEFADRLTREGLHLDLKTRMLFKEKNFYLNGDAYTVGTEACQILEQLADHMTMPSGQMPGEEAIELLYQWYRYGYVEPGTL